MWVEPDTNMSGGEALIRQFIHGKRFYREEFGIESEFLWLPDVFGYSGALPQIMKGCGVPYFVTSKIFWAYHGGDPFPYNLFQWEGIDGAATYIVLVKAVERDEVELLRPVKGTFLEPSETEAADLLPGAYTWSVEARSSRGTLIGYGEGTFEIGKSGT